MFRKTNNSNIKYHQSLLLSIPWKLYCGRCFLISIRIISSIPAWQMMRVLCPYEFDIMSISHAKIVTNSSLVLLPEIVLSDLYSTDFLCYLTMQKHFCKEKNYFLVFCQLNCDNLNKYTPRLRVSVITCLQKTNGQTQSSRFIFSVDTTLLYR